MARVPKSPQEKKRLSLDKDRRNAYRENDKASRKNIPRARACSHRRVRRGAKAAVERVERMDDEAADCLQSTLSTPRLQKGRWKKYPDKPLRFVLARKLARRLPRAE